MLASQIAEKTALLRQARRVRQQTGKGLLAQLIEILRLRRGPGQLSAQDYYDYGLYDDNRFSERQKTEFGSWQLMEALPERLNDVRWDATSQDKLTFYTVLKGLGLPGPAIQAITWHRPRFAGDIPCFTPPAAIADFIRNDIRYPFFCKPIRGNLGRGAISVQSYDRASDELLLGDRSRLPLREFLRQPDDTSGYGYLFQELLQPHPELERLCGPRVSSVRFVVLAYDDGPKLFRTLWKIPTGDNMIDNFSKGKSGNLLARINPDNGVVEQVFSGLGLERREESTHPDTGMRLIDVKLPVWKEAVEVCLQAASAFAGYRWQGWDIALCPSGPVILEVNHVQGLHSMQYVYDAGALDSQLQDFIDQYAKSP